MWMRRSMSKEILSIPNKGWLGRLDTNNNEYKFIMQGNFILGPGNILSALPSIEEYTMLDERSILNIPPYLKDENILLIGEGGFYLFSLYLVDYRKISLIDVKRIYGKDGRPIGVKLEETEPNGSKILCLDDVIASGITAGSVGKKLKEYGCDIVGFASCVTSMNIRKDNEFRKRSGSSIKYVDYIISPYLVDGKITRNGRTIPSILSIRHVWKYWKNNDYIEYLKRKRAPLDDLKFIIELFPEYEEFEEVYRNVNKKIQIGEASSLIRELFNYVSRFPETIILDLDRTLTRSDFDVIKEIIRGKLTEEFVNKYNLPINELWEYVKNDENIREKYEDMWNELAIKSLENYKKDPLIPGIRKKLKKLIDRGKEIIVLTNSHKNYASRLLGELSKWVKIISSDILPKDKPSPEAYEYLKEIVDKRSSLYLDDDKRNVEMAKNKGIISVRVENGYDLKKRLGWLR